ncbi:MAG: NUDIX domain-containing protein [Brumimicrobium sp.]
MYKVFIDNSSINFQKEEKFSTNIPANYLPNLDCNDFNEFREMLNNVINEPNFYMNGSNPETILKDYFKNFKWIEAAGGIVKNETNKKSLFIFRNNKWDLPKGKMEKNETPEETAIREIQEECGLNKIKIVYPLSPTYHVYHAYNNYWIKKTHWFVLKTEEKEIKPQLEENITDIKWIDESEAKLIEDNTYSSILELRENWF